MDNLAELGLQGTADPGMTLLLLGALCLVGVAAGWVNTIAGGGSLLSVPAMMLLGMPADLANGTGRIAILSQNISGSAAYHRAGKLDVNALKRLAPVVLVGALLGSLAAVRLDAETFRPVLITAFTLMAGSVFIPGKRFVDGTATLNSNPGWTGWLALFVAGFYGGFLQAGVGLVLLAVLGSAWGLDLLRANALKVATIGLYTVASVAVFVWHDKVVWVPALALAVGTATGARLGVRFALQRGQKAIRRVVFVMVLASCTALWWR